MHIIEQRIEFDAAHRLVGHEGKCKYIHGHRYAAIISVTAPGLDKLGCVIDFSVVKERIKAWIDKYWDHNILLHESDPLLVAMRGLVFVDTKLAGWEVEFTTDMVWGGKMPYIMKCNPTAENMATILHHVAVQELIGPVSVVSVKVFETPNCAAVYS